MTVYGKVQVELTREDLTRYFLSYLEKEHIKERWIQRNRNGKEVVMEEVATSHRFDTEVGDADDVAFVKLRLALSIRDCIRELEKLVAQTVRR